MTRARYAPPALSTVFACSLLLTLSPCPVAWAEVAANPSGNGGDQFSCDPQGEPNVFRACTGDCNGSGTVTVDEIVTLVNIVLGAAPVARCSPLVGTPLITDVLRAVNRALFGCEAVTRYRLTQGSKITYYASPAMPTFEEPLSGDFMLVDRGYVPQFAVMQVTALDFRGSSLAINPETHGRVGCVQIGAAVPAPYILSVNTVVGDAAVSLSGFILISECCSPPPRLEELMICGPGETSAPCDAILSGNAPGYVLNIVASREK